MPKQKGSRRGQLIQRSGSWQVRIFVGRDESGKRRYHSKTFARQKDAEKYLTKSLRERDTGSFVEPSQQTLRRYLAEWLEAAVKGRVRSRTYDDYHRIISKHINPALGDFRLAQLTPVMIQRLYSAMHDRGLSRAVTYVHAVLGHALKQAVLWQLLTANPVRAVRPPKQRRREMLSLNPSQTAALLRVAESDRLHALYVVLVMGGLRPSEAIALRWTDLVGDRLRVQRTVRWLPGGGFLVEDVKTGKSRRSLPLSFSTLSAIQGHRIRQVEERLAAGPGWEDHGLMFCSTTGTPLQLANIRRRSFLLLLKAANLPKVRLYDLRHTSATLALAAGEHPKIVAERLGHSTVPLTLDTSSHVTPDMQYEAAERLERLLVRASATDGAGHRSGPI